MSEATHLLVLQPAFVAGSIVPAGKVIEAAFVTGDIDPDIYKPVSGPVPGEDAAVDYEALYRAELARKDGVSAPIVLAPAEGSALGEAAEFAQPVDRQPRAK